MSDKLAVWWDNFKTDPKSSIAGILTLLGLAAATFLPDQASAIQGLLGKFSNFVVALVIFLTGLFSLLGTTKSEISVKRMKLSQRITPPIDKIDQ